MITAHYLHCIITVIIHIYIYIDIDIDMCIYIYIYICIVHCDTIYIYIYIYCTIIYRSHFGSSVQPLWLNLVSVYLPLGGGVFARASNDRAQPFASAEQGRRGAIPGDHPVGAGHDDQHVRNNDEEVRTDGRDSDHHE